MKEQISIKVSIADRVFPLKVSAEEEKTIKKAAELVNKKMRIYIEQYLIKDKQSVLSMCALELATELINHDEVKNSEKQKILEMISEIDELITD